MLSILLITYGLVFAVELVGDKILYTLSTLGTRYHPLPVLCGAIAAFMIKMLVAALLGQVILELPEKVVSAVSVVTFFSLALILIMRGREEKPLETVQRGRWSSAALVSFGTVVFAEWGDSGQLATAALVARFHAPLVVWLGATLALSTKGALAVTLGVALKKRVPSHVLRYAAVTMCVVMGVLSAFRVK